MSVATLESHYKENFDRLVKFFTYKHHGNVMFAEDIIQSAYTKALKNIDSFNADLDFSKWFNEVLKNAERDCIRTERRLGMCDELDEENYDPINVDLSYHFTQKVVREHLSGILEPHRSVLLLYFVYHYSPREIHSVVDGVDYRRVTNIIHDSKRKMLEES